MRIRDILFLRVEAVVVEGGGVGQSVQSQRRRDMLQRGGALPSG